MDYKMSMNGPTAVNEVVAETAEHRVIAGERIDDISDRTIGIIVVAVREIDRGHEIGFPAPGRPTDGQ